MANPLWPIGAPRYHNKPNIWLKTNQNEHGEENEPPNQQPAAQVDIFSEREGAGGMRVGRDFQAKVPPMLPLADRRNVQAEGERALLVWSPSDQLSEEEIEKYLEISRDKYQYSGEQALGLLFWHKYDVPRALQDLGNFTPHPEEWTVEDKVLFEQAFQFHGKAFDKIRQMKHNGSTGKFCANCSIPSTELHCWNESKDKMCNTCFLYWKRTGEFRPLLGPLKRGERQVLTARRQRQRPPNGMYIDHADLNTLASSAPQAGNVTLQGLEKDVLDQKCRVQVKKQEIEILKRGLPKEYGINKFKPKDWSPTSSRVNSRWTQDELMLAAQGVRRYGREFQKIAEVIGTKTEAHLKAFYASNRRRFGLDDLLREHQLENLDGLVEDSERNTETTA